MDEIKHGIWRRRDVLMNTDTLNHKTHLLCFHCLFTCGVAAAVAAVATQSQWCAVVAEKTKTTNENNKKKFITNVCK